MTERESNTTLLEDLLASSDADTHSTASRPPATKRATSADPQLIERQEMSLLRAAHEIGTPTLAPDGRTSAAFEPRHESFAAGSFGNEFKALVQRYPLQAVLVAGGLGYALTRRRS